MLPKLYEDKTKYALNILISFGFRRPLIFLPVNHMIITVVNVSNAYSVVPVTYAQPVTCLISQMSVVCYLLYSLRDKNTS